MRTVVVRLRLFRYLSSVLFAANAAALLLRSPFASFLVAMLSLACVDWCIRCANCGKSPFVKWKGQLRIGIPLPERQCSKCGWDAARGQVEAQGRQLDAGSD